MKERSQTLAGFKLAPSPKLQADFGGNRGFSSGK
jgi:hypothetical protein